MKLFFRRLLYLSFYAPQRLVAILTNHRLDTAIYYKRFFRTLSFFKRRYTYELGNATIFYNPLRSAIGHRIYFEGGSESEELALCSPYIKKDSVVFDIGANIGIHSVFFSQIAVRGKVFSFEPSRVTYNSLLTNVQNIPNVIPLNIGITNASGLYPFNECEDDALSSLKDTRRSLVTVNTTILCFSVDEIARLIQLPKLDFVKIDVEGLEQQVIEGMTSTINRFKPVIFCEIYGGENSNTNPEKTINDLILLGYKAFVMAGGTLNQFTIHDDKEANYLFLPL